KLIALAVFSSDAISSTAYATEEILFVVAVGGSSLALGINVLIPIAIAVAVLLAIVTTSYRQTIYAYPSGGGSYIVSRENLGEKPSLIAGASLLVEYILTVAVSVSAGTAAILSIPQFNSLQPYRVEVCLFFILLLMLANLRGLKESGKLFAGPTYLYIFILGALIVVGLSRVFFGHIDQIHVIKSQFAGQLSSGNLGLFLILKGFSSGAVALTGVEAISNGVPAFKRPESKNAATTLVWMATILGTLFLGVSILAHHLRPYPSEHRTVMSQLGAAVFGQGSIAFWVLQLATCAILTLAANTAYADFPRLSSIIAKDSYLPRQLANRGDRLVFSNGIIILSVAAAILIVVFGGLTNALIPLYAVGVFVSFTLSQSGMVIHHRKEQEPGYRRNMVINGVGAVATFVVAWVILITKFYDPKTGLGAWVSAVVIGLVVVMFLAVHRHYKRVAVSLNVPFDYQPPRMNHTVIVLVGRVHRGVLQALAYARSLNPNHLIALTVVTDEEEQERIERQWSEYRIQVPLEIAYSAYRELSGPVMRYIDEVDLRWDQDIITVVIPEFVVTHWWEHLLHNQSALVLKGRLLFRRNTVVTSVPYHVDRVAADPASPGAPDWEAPQPKEPVGVPPAD
ncbi:MAG: amino acid/polyamine/organocation transporter, superfamily, partial [Actinomycetia bacterium]|nr:amino acid/polyamine/organocation transporter, superfamily [Actinomycetes bacterium]